VKKLTFIFVIVICGLLQATVLNYFKIFNVKPDLLLIGVVIASIFFEPAWAISLSLFAGVLKDIFSVNAFGVHLVLFFLWSYLIIRLSKKIILDSQYIQLALIFIIAVLNNIAMRSIFLFLGNFISWGIFLRIIFIEPIYTTLISYPAFKFAQVLLVSEPLAP